MKILAWLIIVVILGCGGYYYVRHNTTLLNDPAASVSPAGAPAAPVAMPVTVAEVISRDAQVWHEFSGRLEAVDHVEIRPRVSGTLEAIHFEDGAMVKKGDLLFTIDARPYIAEVSRAEAALAAAKAQIALAKTGLERAERLLKDKAIARREYDEIENSQKTSSANLQAAQAQLTTAKLDLEYTKITAPISGRISRAEVTVGNVVQAGGNPNPPLLSTIVSSNPIYAGFDMDEQTYISFLKDNSAAQTEKIPAIMTLAAQADKTYPGHVHSFDNHLDTASSTVRVRAIFDNPEGTLIPGLFARIKVGEPSAKPRILITDRAINTDQDRKYVYVVNKDNGVEYRSVKPGPVIDGLRVIESGLSAGDRIVVIGLQRVRPGATVLPEIIPMDQANSDQPAQPQPEAPQ